MGSCRSGARLRMGVMSRCPRPRHPPPAPRTCHALRVGYALDEYTDAQVGAILNEPGLRTGAGEAFDAVSVQWVRPSAGLTSFKDRLIAAGMLTGTQIATQLDVRRTTIGRWRREGRLEARICNETGQWLYAPGQQRPSDGRPPSETAAPGAEDISRVGGAV